MKYKHISIHISHIGRLETEFERPPGHRTEQPDMRMSCPCVCINLLNDSQSTSATRSAQ